MAISTMPSVIGNGITGKKAGHIGGQSVWPATQKDMCVIVHECPGVNGGLCLSCDLSHPGYKFISVLVIIYDFFHSMPLAITWCNVPGESNLAPLGMASVPFSLCFCLYNTFCVIGKQRPPVHLAQAPCQPREEPGDGGCSEA